MRQIVLYSAISIDNFIAKKDGNIDWLSATPPPSEGYGYEEFYKSIGITLMGRKTYNQILSFGVDFPYPATTNYVFTSKSKANTKEVTFIHEESLTFIQGLKKESGKDIWLIGGASLNTFLLQHQMIDVLILTQLPVLLGNGIPLFNFYEEETNFELKESKTFENGVIQMTYLKK